MPIPLVPILVLTRALAQHVHNRRAARAALPGCGRCGSPTECRMTCCDSPCCRACFAGMTVGGRLRCLFCGTVR